MFRKDPEYRVKYKGKTHPLTVYVVKGRSLNNLLSWPMSVQMNLVRRVDEMVFIRGHMQAYGEHGTLKIEPVKIHLKENAQTFTHSTTRTAPYAAVGKGGASENGVKWHHQEGDSPLTACGFLQDQHHWGTPKPASVSTSKD